MGVHSKYGPSSAERWLTCPGSLDIPKDENKSEGSVYAREGTAAHELAEQCWMVGGNPSRFIGSTVKGFEVTTEMAEAVQVYLDAIEAAYEALPGDNKEIRLEARLIHPLFEDFGGTVDCLITSNKTFSIVDFKYGAGVVVEAINSSQLSCYALLALVNASDGMKGPYALTIVQPRAKHEDGPVRTWFCDDDTLDAFYGRVMSVMKGERKGELCAGDHCRWCPGKVNCPTLAELTREIAHKEFSPEEMTPHEAADVLGIAKPVRMYLEAVAKWAHTQLDKGGEIPGHKLVQTFGNRRYSVSEDDVFRRCRSRKFGKKKIYETKLLSPAKLEKLVGKDLIASLTERPLKGTAVVPEDDKRPAVIRETAAEEFAQEETNTDG